MRFGTPKEIDEAGFDVRLWCFTCARGAVIDGIIWARFEDRGLPLELEAAAARFPCAICRSADQVLILPATAISRRNVTGTDFVAAFFHGMRGKAKKAKQIRGAQRQN